MHDVGLLVVVDATLPRNRASADGMPGIHTHIHVYICMACVPASLGSEERPARRRSAEQRVKVKASLAYLRQAGGGAAASLAAALRGGGGGASYGGAG